MSEAEPTAPATKRAEIEKRRADRALAIDKGREAQIGDDLGAIDALEEAEGQSYRTMTSNGFKPGVPVKVAYRAPSSPEYKRYKDQVSRAASKNDAKARTEAQELLATVCLVYPAPDTKEREALLDAFPGTLISVAIECAKLAELKAEDEGKG
jgi:hypothetical protein